MIFTAVDDKNRIRFIMNHLKTKYSSTGKYFRFSVFHEGPKTKKWFAQTFPQAHIVYENGTPKLEFSEEKWAEFRQAMGEKLKRDAA